MKQQLHPSFLSRAKGALHTGAQIARAVKGAWDLGKLIYSGLQTVAPIARLELL